VKKLMLTGALAAVAACRGSVSEDPPIHIIPDMDWQDKYQAQGESAFFADGRSMRAEVDGTVARGSLKDDAEYFQGKGADGKFVARLPTAKVQAALKVDTLDKLMSRGQQRYNIYCTPCHDQSGSGRGLVSKAVREAGYPNVANLATDHAIGLPDGELYDIVSNGVRTMPAYGHQVPEADRWAIVAWLRVLQRSQHGSLEDVPSEKRGSIEKAEVTP
jgi:mono/diheme cytochrome c family protein